MPVTILGSGGAIPAPQNASEPEVKLDQFEVFGRLNMTHSQIAAYYGITRGQAVYLMKKPEVRNAYDLGRAQTVIAVRQKQLQLALAGNVQLLIHAGVQFGDQEREGPIQEPQDFEPSRFSWDAKLKKEVTDLRQKFSGDQAETG